MKPDAVKPLACPFCGNDIVDFITTQGGKWGSAVCTDCGAYGPEVRTLYDPKDRWHTEAIKEWNRRTPPAGWKLISDDALAYLIEARDSLSKMDRESHVHLAITRINSFLSRVAQSDPSDSAAPENDAPRQEGE